MRRLTLLLLVTAAFSTVFAAEAEVEKAEKAWAAAVLARDFAALDKIYSDDLLYAHSTGVIESKQQYLGKLKSGAQRYEKLPYEKLKVVSHGDAAITHSILRMIGKTQGEPFDNHIMMIHMWVKRGGIWKLVAHQTTKLP